MYTCPCFPFIASINIVTVVYNAATDCMVVTGRLLVWSLRVSLKPTRSTDKPQKKSWINRFPIHFKIEFHSTHHTYVCQDNVWLFMLVASPCVHLHDSDRNGGLYCVIYASLRCLSQEITIYLSNILTGFRIVSAKAKSFSALLELYWCRPYPYFDSLAGVRHRSPLKTPSWRSISIFHCIKEMLSFLYTVYYNQRAKAKGQTQTPSIT